MLNAVILLISIGAIGYEAISRFQNPQPLPGVTIAIIAAILFPVFAQAQEDGRKTLCLSNTRQIGFAITMYAQDYDETIVPWLNATEFPRDTARSDRRIWVELLQPFIRNGLFDRKPNIAEGAQVSPAGVFTCRSFNVADFARVSAAPDCDGPGNLFGWPPRQFYGQYGITAGQSGGSCTQMDPYYKPPGSDPLNSDPPITGTLAQIQRPAETVIVTDGATFMSSLPNNGIGVFWGCDAANTHQGGGNHVFMDGHSKWIAGNSERYLRKGADDCWYKFYYTENR